MRRIWVTVPAPPLPLLHRPDYHNPQLSPPPMSAWLIWDLVAVLTFKSPFVSVFLNQTNFFFCFFFPHFFFSSNGRSLVLSFVRDPTAISRRGFIVKVITAGEA